MRVSAGISDHGRVTPSSSGCWAANSASASRSLCRSLRPFDQITEFLHLGIEQDEGRDRLRAVRPAIAISEIPMLAAAQDTYLYRGDPACQCDDHRHELNGVRAPVLGDDQDEQRLLPERGPIPWHDARAADVSLELVTILLHRGEIVVRRQGALPALNSRHHGESPPVVHRPGHCARRACAARSRSSGITSRAQRSSTDHCGSGGIGKTRSVNPRSR
jgi:hypothetical protein